MPLKEYMEKHFKMNRMYQDYKNKTSLVVGSDIVNVKEYKDFNKMMEDVEELFETKAVLLNFRHWILKNYLTIEFIGHALLYNNVTMGQVGQAKSLCIKHIFERI